MSRKEGIISPPPLHSTLTLLQPLVRQFSSLSLDYRKREWRRNPSAEFFKNSPFSSFVTEGRGVGPKTNTFTRLFHASASREACNEIVNLAKKLQHCIVLIRNSANPVPLRGREGQRRIGEVTRGGRGFPLMPLGGYGRWTLSLPLRPKKRLKNRRGEMVGRC